MLIFIVLFSLFMAGVGFIVTPSNARYLLSGYNTMTDEERKSVDIQGYLRFFKKFHLVLGASMLLIGLMIYFIKGPDLAVLSVAVAPIAGYIWFIIKSGKYERPESKNRKLAVWFAVPVLAVTLCLVIFLFFRGWQDNEAVLSENSISFTGMYGMEIAIDDIDTVYLADKLPKITLRVHGFATGTILKGKFRSAEHGNVTLLVNERKSAYVAIFRKKDTPVFYSGKNADEAALVTAIDQKLRSK